MPIRRVEMDTTGHTVRANIRRLRKDQRLSLRDVAERLEKAGRKIAHTSVSDIENGSRRLDVDDLLAFAIALDVSPNTLLMPDARHADEKVTATATGTLTARQLWKWLTATSFGRPNAPMIDLDWRNRSRPTWLIEQESAEIERNWIHRMQQVLDEAREEHNGND